MALALIIGAAGVAVTVLGWAYYAQWDTKRWEREIRREDLFNKIKGYNNDF